MEHFYLSDHEYKISQHEGKTYLQWNMILRRARSNNNSIIYYNSKYGMCQGLGERNRDETSERCDKLVRMYQQLIKDHDFFMISLQEIGKDWLNSVAHSDYTMVSKKHNSINDDYYNVTLVKKDHNIETVDMTTQSNEWPCFLATRVDGLIHINVHLTMKHWPIFPNMWKFVHDILNDETVQKYDVLFTGDFNVNVADKLFYYTSEVDPYIYINRVLTFNIIGNFKTSAVDHFQYIKQGNIQRVLRAFPDTESFHDVYKSINLPIALMNKDMDTIMKNVADRRLMNERHRILNVFEYIMLKFPLTLIEKIYESQSEELKNSIRMSNYFGGTICHALVKSLKKESEIKEKLAFILNHTKNSILARRDDRGQTALHAAALGLQTTVIQFIQEKMSLEDRKIADRHGDTFLTFTASRCCNRDIRFYTCYTCFTVRFNGDSECLCASRELPNIQIFYSRKTVDADLENSVYIKGLGTLKKENRFQTEKAVGLLIDLSEIKCIRHVEGFIQSEDLTTLSKIKVLVACGSGNLSISNTLNTLNRLRSMINDRFSS